MGSFNATCSISGMTLTYGQSTYIQLLAPTMYTEKNAILNEPGLLVANEYAQMFFAPFAFPIKGQYDDYGYLTGIQPDENTRLLEDFFGVKIKHLVILLCSNKEDRDEANIQNRDIFEKLNFTYFRGEVYEFLTLTPGQSSQHKARKNYKAKILTRLVDDTKRKLIEDEKTYEYFRKMDFYISQQTEINTFVRLPVTDSLKDEMFQQMNLIFNYGDLRRHLLPSISGGQDENWKYLIKLNRFSNGLMQKSIKNEE